MSKRYRTLIADDEPPARERLSILLSEMPEIELIGQAQNGLEALEMINRQKPDLLFLDIQMPGLTGFEVLQKAEHFPVVVFCTAYDDYALQAFETPAIDYIVKPIKEERIRKSVEKFTSLKENQQKEELLQLLEKYAGQNQRRPLTSIPVRTGDRMLFVRIGEISFFKAEEKYVTIVMRDGKQHLTEHSLRYLEAKLEPDFIRIHRSLLVNKAMIKEVNRHFASRFTIQMEDSQHNKLISGRNYCEQIKQLFEL